VTTLEFAKSLGAITRKQGTGAVITFTNMTDCAHFRHVAKIDVRERFAPGGRAIKYVLTCEQALREVVNV
jgi:hypothetical protein